MTANQVFARLEARVSPEQKALFERAAALRGSTLTDFLVSSAQQAAEEAIRTHETMMLTARDSAAFVQSLLNPPAPNERLKVAATQYKERYGE